MVYIKILKANIYILKTIVIILVKQRERMKLIQKHYNQDNELLNHALKLRIAALNDNLKHYSLTAALMFTCLLSLRIFTNYIIPTGWLINIILITGVFKALSTF